MVKVVLRHSFIVDDNYVVGGQVEGFPCEGQITQTFGMMSVTGVPHNGIDIAVFNKPVASPSVAVVDGTYNWGTFGNWVTLYHGWDEELKTDLYSVYAHLSRIDCAPGDVVQPGTLLGISGNTGLSTGPHLHWGFSRDKLISGQHSRNFDPYLFIKRAETEEEPMGMADWESGLIGIANGDFQTMLSAYAGLDKLGYFAAVNASDDVAPPYDPTDDTATQLNASAVRSKRIMFLATDKVNGPPAWEAVN